MCMCVCVYVCMCVCVCGGTGAFSQSMPAPDTGPVMSSRQSRMPDTVTGSVRGLGPTAVSQRHHTNPNHLAPI